MRIRQTLGIFCLIPLAVAACGAEPEEMVQGSWLGTWDGNGMGGKNVAQIYGLGRGEFQAIFTAYDSGEQDKGEFTFAIRGATTADGRVVFDQKIDLGGLGSFTFAAEIKEGKFHGTYSNGKEFEGTIDLKRVQENPAAVGMKPLPGAVSLFNGKDLDGWRIHGAETGEWRVQEGVLISPKSDRLSTPKTGHLACLPETRHAQIHLEFRIPYLPEKRGEARGQSGVFLLGKHELQIVDSFGFPRAKDVQGYFIDTDALGAVFGLHAPTELPVLPPGEWQAFDITVKAGQPEAEGAASGKTELTVQLNGKTIHERVQLDKATPGAPSSGKEAGPMLMLQNAGQGVEFRNLWYVPLETAK